MNKVCILGGTGFIGRHLCEMLQLNNLKATVISRSADLGVLSSYLDNITLVKRDSAGLRACLENCDVLIHLASQSLPGIGWDDPASELSRCGVPEVEFLQQFADMNPRCHIIYASSGGQIYGSGHTHPINELTITSPVTSYALGKQIIESTLNIISFSQGNPVTILRIANPAGRWQVSKRHGLINAAISAGLNGNVLSLYGDGGNVRDYFDADDLANLFIKLAFSPQKFVGTFNVGSNLGLTELEVINLVTKSINQEINLKFVDARPFDLKYSLLDSSKVQNITGWHSQISLEDTIKRMVEFKKNWKAIL